MPTPSTFLFALARASGEAAALALLVWIATSLLGRRMPPAWRFCLWSLVFLRVVLPLGIPVHVNFNGAMHRFTPAASPPSAAMFPSRHAPNTALPTRIVETPNPQPAPTPQPADRDILLPSLIALWLAGVAACLLWMARGTLKLWRALRLLVPHHDPRILAEFAAAMKKLGVHRSPRLLNCPSDLGPALAGIWRPAILLPASLAADLHPRELRLVLLHELAHFRRRDVLIHCLVTFLAAIHWFNPLIWFSRRRLRVERELACDQMVLDASAAESSPADYGNILLKLIVPIAAPATIGMFDLHDTLKRRIDMIAQYESSRRPGRLIGLAVALVVGFVALTKAEEPEPAPPPPPVPAASTYTLAAVPSTQPLAVTELPVREGNQINSPTASPAIDTDTQGDAAMDAILNRKMPQVQFNANSLADVIEFLRDVTSANIAVNWKALEQAGISRDVPVTLKVRDVTLDAALDLILQDVSGNSALTYTVQGGVIRISTAQVASGTPVVKTYEVAAMVHSDADVEALKKVIENNVEADSWHDKKGNACSISIFKTKLVITTSSLNHRRVAALLQSLKDGETTAEVQGITVPAAMAKEIKDLWGNDYAPKIIYVNGQPKNQAVVEEEFRKAVIERVKQHQNPKVEPPPTPTR